MNVVDIIDHLEREAKKPLLHINSANNPETAKELAALLADRLLSNGSFPAKISINDDGLAVARQAIEEMICVEAHEICQPVRHAAGRPRKGVKDER